MNPDNAEVCADCGMELKPESAAPVSPAPAHEAAPAPAAPFDFAPEGAHAASSPAPGAAPAPVEAAHHDPFAGSNWDFDLDKGEAAIAPPAHEPHSAMEPAIVPDSPNAMPESSALGGESSALGGESSPLGGESSPLAPTQLIEPAPSFSPSAPASSGSAKLVLKRGGALTGDVFSIGPSATVGRFDPESGPVDVDMANLPEAVYISRHHAELMLRDGQWLVKDLGSRNGTFVKNAEGFARVTGETPIQNGDEVAFGNARFEFQSA